MYRGCGACGEEWAFGEPPTCKCKDRVTLVPKREWVGLTDADKIVIRGRVGYNKFMSAEEYAEKVQDATESKLKEKNT
jgi:hypothetical protein